MAKPKRTGRPPRRDNPQRIEVRIPGTLRTWLRRQAAREQRYEGDLLATLVAAYRTKVERRGNA